MADALAPLSVCSVGATLGEGPVWDAAAGALWFVDIKQRRIHRFDPALGILRSWTAPAQPGWVLPHRAGGLVAGLQTGLHLFDPATGGFELLYAPEPDLPGNRLNDATVDARGRLWFGSMDDAEQAATGSAYRWDGERCERLALPPAAIVNGPALSPDGRSLYHVDTLGRRIWAVVLHDDGSHGVPQPFAEIEAGAGHPDGPTVDAEGCLWVGLFGGWGMRRYAPDGRLMDHVPFPVANVTKLAFGGGDLRTAYATTARKGLDAAALARQPLAGDLFAFDAGVAGLPAQRLAV